MLKRAGSRQRTCLAHLCRTHENLMSHAHRTHRQHYLFSGSKCHVIPIPKRPKKRALQVAKVATCSVAPTLLWTRRSVLRSTEQKIHVRSPLEVRAQASAGSISVGIAACQFVTSGNHLSLYQGIVPICRRALVSRTWSRVDRVGQQGDRH